MSGTTLTSLSESLAESAVVVGEAVVVGVAAGDGTRLPELAGVWTRSTTGAEASTWAAGLPAGDGGGAVSVVLPQPAQQTRDGERDRSQRPVHGQNLD